MKRKVIGRVGVLAGGQSNERDISLMSGKAVHEALLREGIDAVLLDVHGDAREAITRNKIDVAFIALHGRFGEDGTVQKMLEDLKIAYTGSGPEASRTTIDKVLAKKVFEKSALPVPRYVVFKKDDYRIEDCYDLGFPMVVKPHLEGSSIGLSVVKGKEKLPFALDKAFEYGDLVLLEEYISGRELTVGIINDEPLPVIEIVTKGSLYDFEAKYKDPETKYLVPAPLDEATAAKARELGKRSHRALGCRCFSRVDIMMNNLGEMYVLEANTIPGMTERSLLPKAAQAIGLSFGDLCIKLINNALLKR
ncbi:MAG: D-alanine--D-alanine ligase [Candidatus Omnitrophica bacterium]|nr:D-alanine--D-alanine ligase [Candidatus Omnitrophota bacterium]